MSEHCWSWFDADIDLDLKEVFIDETLGYLADLDLYICMKDYYYYWNAKAKHIIAKHVDWILANIVDDQPRVNYETYTTISRNINSKISVTHNKSYA